MCAQVDCYSGGPNCHWELVSRDSKDKEDKKGKEGDTDMADVTLKDMLNGTATEREMEALGAVLKENTGFSDMINEGKDALEKKMRAAEEKKRKEEEARQKLLDSLGDNQTLFSLVTGGRLPKSKVDHVIDIFPDDEWPEEHRCNIPQLDEDYVWDVEVLEAMLLTIKLGERGLLVGFPGTGKTSAVKNLAAIRKQPYARFNGKGGIDPDAFLGQMQAVSKVETLSDGSEVIRQHTEFAEGLMPQAVRNGYMTTIDEVFKLAPDIQMALQSLYEKDGFLMLDNKPGTIEDKHVQPGPQFQMFCTDNTCGTGDNLDLFAAGQMQDTSTLDRFSITIPVDYLKEADEVDMLVVRFPKVKKRDIEKLVTFAGLIRTSYSQSQLPVTLSPRGLMTMCGLLECGLSKQRAIDMVFINKLGEDGHRNTAKEQVRTAI